MLRELSLLLAAAALVASCANSYEGVSVYEAVRTESDPMADGFEWNSIGSIFDADSLVNDNTLTFRSCWTSDSLYLRFEVTDENLQAFETEKDSKKLFRDDMVEFLLDPRMDRDSLWLEDDIIYHINILGQKKDDRGTPEGISDSTWDGVARYVIKVEGTICDTTDVDRGYSVTVAVPWTEIGKKAESGLQIGLNYAVNDNEGDDQKHMFNWTRSPKMRRPDIFGILRLK